MAAVLRRAGASGTTQGYRAACKIGLSRFCKKNRVLLRKTISKRAQQKIILLVLESADLRIKVAIPARMTICAIIHSF